MTDLPGYGLFDEHDLLWQTVRKLADAEIAPAVRALTCWPP